MAQERTVLVQEVAALVGKRWNRRSLVHSKILVVVGWYSECDNFQYKACFSLIFWQISQGHQDRLSVQLSRKLKLWIKSYVYLSVKEAGQEESEDLPGYVTQEPYAEEPSNSPNCSSDISRGRTINIKSIREVSEELYKGA